MIVLAIRGQIIGLLDVPKFSSLMTTEPNIHLGDENNEIDAQEMSTTDEGESTPRASATHLQVKNEEINDQLAQVAASSPTDSPFVASIEKRSRHLPAAAPSDQDGKVEAQMSDAEDCQSNHSDRYDAQIKRDTLTYIDIPQTFSFVHQPPSSTTYRFDLKDASTISSHQLDEEIRTTLLDGRTTRSAAMVEATATSTFATLVTRRSAAAAATNVSAIRVIKTLALTSATGSRKVPSLQQRAAILEAGRENRRAERDRRRALVARHRAVTGGSSPTSSASSSPSTEKMRCLRDRKSVV